MIVPFRRFPEHGIQIGAHQLDILNENRAQAPLFQIARDLIVAGVGMIRHERGGRLRPVDVPARLIFIAADRRVGIGHVKGNEALLVGLPGIIHIVPAAAKRNREDILFNQIFTKRLFIIFQIQQKVHPLVPPIDSVAVGIGPVIVVIMQGQLVVEGFNGVKMIFFH